MPLFPSASGFQINGGSFLDIAGDINLLELHTTQRTIGPGLEQGNPLMVEFMTTTGKGSGRQLLGLERNSRQIGAARVSPYDISRRPQLPGRSPNLPPEWPPSVSPSALLPSHSIPRPSSFSQPDSDQLAVPRPLSNDGDTSGDGCRQFHPAHRAIEYPSANHCDGTRSSSNRHLPRVSSNLAIAVNRSVFAGDYPLDQQTSISGGTFIGGNVNNVNHIQRNGETGLHILRHAVVSDAFHDSAERYPQPKCHPETRTRMLMDLWDWSSENCAESNVLWLHGPAGAGKSAIAQSFCQRLEAESRLGASFFFKRGHPSRGQLKQAISQVVEDNPSIIDRDLSIQLRKLIMEPCRHSIPGRTLVIVVDGLDECEGQIIQQEILRSIGNAVHEGPSPLRFLIASRPEDHIQEIFGGPLKEDIDFSISTIILGFTEADSESPFGPLDQLYTQVLSDAPARLQFLSILTVIASDLGLLELRPGDVRMALRRLSSVMHISIGSPHFRPSCPAGVRVRSAIAGTDSSDLSHSSHDDGQITPHHASFLDFLRDPTRAGIFYVDGSSQQIELACHIVKAFSHMYQSGWQILMYVLWLRPTKKAHFDM
ncbi:hypothetical protein B0H13DRAFT_2013973 [Mycena leptocephala]|nr:hypothetical protein B0H13DRAFT_2013973 [Mycena leptocephala]